MIIGNIWIYSMTFVLPATPKGNARTLLGPIIFANTNIHHVRLTESLYCMFVSTVSFCQDIALTHVDHCVSGMISKVSCVQSDLFIFILFCFIFIYLFFIIFYLFHFSCKICDRLNSSISSPYSNSSLWIASHLPCVAYDTSRYKDAFGK